jgi:hypothetical protein
VKRGQCGTVLTLADLSPNDRAEVEKFKRYLGVHAARKAGADPSACDLLEAAIYFPDGIGDTDPRGDA